MKKSIRPAVIWSGIGMGLLLGIIMGLSVSEVVKVIMGTLTAALGAFLGFDKRSFAGMSSEEYAKENDNLYFTALRAGWFGVSVVVGILLGMFIRTHEVFTPSVASHVNEWTEAGFEPEYARKLVLYQRLAINPKSGEMGPVTEAQRGYQSNLFSSEQALNLCGETDPEQWNKDWNVAKNAIKGLKDTSLVGLIDVADTAIPELKRFEFLKALNTLLCQMGRSDTKLCELGTDLDAWKKDVLGAEMAGVVASATADKQVDLLKKLSELVCTLEKAK